MPRLEARVLGPLELSAGGVPVPVERPLERAIAARLALARGAAVPDETLARDLWRDDTPFDRLRVVVFRLRRTLGEHASSVRRTAAGYCMDAIPVDLIAVEKATASRDALDQWRGPALADLRAFPFAAVEGERLDALRLNLQVDWIEAEGSAAADAELERLVAEHPLHERLVCLSALTLYRAGQQADALDRLARLRRALADELGVDPSPATAELELRLLRQDPELVSRRPRTLPPVNLAPAATTFVGRDGEHASLLDLLASPTLVTLTGGPGAGKTRLAREIAAAAQASGRPVAWLDLAPLTGAEAVGSALAAAVGTDAEPAAKLRGALLVVDNAEHVVDAVAALVSALRRTASDLSVLVTSQRPLRIATEEVRQLGPLPPGAARALFNSRSREEPGPDAQVDAICAAVDRMPLAIELAAGLTRTLSVNQIANRVDDRLRLLVGGPRDAGIRHTSLRTALDWSHDLLDEPARVVLRRLAVFSGGCTLEAAEQVIPGDGLDRADVAALLGELADRCLVTVDRHRFGLLETVREYATDQLRAFGEEDAVRRRHARWCVELASTTEKYGGADHNELLRLLADEESNLRTALSWSLDAEPAWVMDVIAPSWWYWWSRGLMSEARDWLRRSLERTDPAPTAERSMALRAAASLTRNSGDFVEARMLGEEALAAAEQAGDSRGRTAALLGLSITLMAMQDFDAALDLAEQARDGALAAGNDRVVGAALNTIGIVLACVRRIDDAEAAFTDSMKHWERMGDRRGIAGLCNTLGNIARWRGDLTGARRRCLESLRRYRDLDLAEGQIDVLDALGCLEIAEGRPAVALRLLTVAGVHRDRLGAPLFVRFEIEDRAAALSACRSALDPAEHDSIVAEARELRFEPIVEELLRP